MHRGDACGSWSERQRFGLYYYHYEPSVAAGNEALLPLALWLHGGTRVIAESIGSDELARTPFIEGQRWRPAALLRPIVRHASNWMSPWIGPASGSHRLTKRPPANLGIASAVLDQYVHAHKRVVDPRRLLIAGASMGGYATWEMILRRPDAFEAAVPICGGGDPRKAHLLNRTRVWIFHSADDPIVPRRASREMFEAMLDARGVSREAVKRELVNRGTVLEALEHTLEPGSSWPELRYTEYTRGGHDAWSRALRDPRLPGFALGPPGQRQRACAE